MKSKVITRRRPSIEVSVAADNREVLVKADRLADKLGKSRSQVIFDALREYVGRTE